MGYTLECARCDAQQTDCCGGSGEGAIVFDGVRLTPDGGGSPELFERPFQVSFGASSFRLVDRRGFERNYNYLDINGMTTEEVKTMISECKCPPSVNPNEHVEITDVDLAIAGSPTVADVEAFAVANGHTDVHIYYIGGGTDGDPDYTWHVDIAGDVIRTEYPQVAAGQIVRYKSGNSWIEATGYGVTYLNTGAGTIFFTIPNDVLLLQVFCWGAPIDLDPTGDLQFVFDHSPTVGYDINDVDIFPPIVQKINMNAKAFGGLSTAPYNYDIDFDPTPSIISAVGGELRMKIENLSGISQWGLIFGF